MANTWNQALTTWGQNAWGEQADVTLTLTGLSATTSVGSVDAYVQPGWGTLEWGYNGWGSVDAAVVRPSGVSATINKSTTAYSATNEISNTSGSAYSAKGNALTSVTPVLDSDTAVCDFANSSWTSASFTANGCLIFNDTATGDPACCTIAFGGDKTVTSGTFTIEFPAAAASTAIIQLA